MLNTSLYKKSRVYDFFMKSLGYDRSLGRFLRSLDLDYAGPIRILDAGCGTGVLGLHLLERFPEAQLVATDLEPNFLKTTLANAEARGISRGRITVGVANITRPHELTHLDGTKETLDDESISIICTGAVVGYSDDIASSIRKMVQLLVPGGTLINIEMNESPVGRFVSRRYQYASIAHSAMQDVLRAEGCEVSFTKLSLVHLPAKLTRVGIIARKPRK